MFSALNPPKYEKNQSIWSNLNRTSLALSIVSYATKTPARYIAVTQDTASATLLEQEILSFSKGKKNCPLVVHFPDWETLPYDHFSPHADIISERLEALYKISTNESVIVIIPITSLMVRLSPKGFLDGRSLILNCGDLLDIEASRTRLEDGGYRRVDTVLEHGEYAIRGSIIDIFAMGENEPYRIDLFDSEIDSIRTFDPSTQITTTSVENLKLLPAHEFPLDQNGIKIFRDHWHSTFDVDHKSCPIYQDICDGISPPGIEYYLPLFFETMGSLLDYFPKPTQIFTLGNLSEAADAYWAEINARYTNLNVDPRRPLLKPTSIYFTVEELFSRLKSYDSINVSEKNNGLKAATQPLPALGIDNQSDRPFKALENFVKGFKGKLLFCADTAGRKEILIEQLQKISIKPETVDDFWQCLASKNAINIAQCPIEKGVILDADDSAIALIAESDLYGTRLAPTRRRKKSVDATEQVIKHLTELAIDAPVVHIDHGVGRYRGLQLIESDGQASEFLTLEYAEEAKLYVPVENLHLISRYSGADPDLAPLHRLGSEAWSKAKHKAAEKVRDAAAELLAIYAQRAARRGTAFPDPAEHYQQFAASFPFEETEDQQTAIDAVIGDMLSNQPMDRLVCGDVGFGKTEVAMRAAFIAAISGKQVAVMVPTTLLAQQHFDNFNDRFAQWPVQVGLLSRFQTNTQANKTLEQVKEGTIDIIIGTHKLIQSDVKYRDLGLVIIDEEHRFGVRQKDRFKSLRAEIDVLAMTATPIPRTLNMSMQGVRDLSIIATPPAKRLSVKTFVQENQPGIIKEAILREILRGGQVYYLHNEVKTIEKAARDIEELIPEARVTFGHGQMRERELEVVMDDFYHKRFNVLVATTIIETGLDIPNANTIVIDRADKFGLAQLHQLRGRVGRSHHQAYAYLLTPPHKKLTQDATKRLEAISQATELGAGFTLATHDLEIRGAGELLGEEQSGQIQHVGFSLYMDMLDRAVKSIKSGKLEVESIENREETEINLRIPALIPEDYLPDVHLRLMLYKRLANTSSEQELNDLQVEIIDRFGLLPEQTKNLIRVNRLRFTADALGIKKIEANNRQIKLDFKANTEVDPLTIVTLVQKFPTKYQMEGANKFKFLDTLDNPESKLRGAEQLLNTLTSKSK
ncbi:transcription-repair coupling factor [Sessilibacter corallicola]|uniref:transcription-repair coupling factor n=1 Tax=Sessilibacter corallicola TaxID=2904075 RepID=UPI001E3B40F1|nr:transcription-repair coupling factor [Sessilibacter corallicola]MCE2029890.1 transcription-repair coupling factor [Sessilibacter corallicola]